MCPNCRSQGCCHPFYEVRRVPTNSCLLVEDRACGPGRNDISHVVDVNPRKTGRFIGGSGQEIIAPSAVRELRPDVVVVMNPIYREEIGSILRSLGLDSELLVA